MQINFFEEFPKKGALKKAKLIKFPCVIYIAARSFKEFKKYKQELKKINPKLEAGYWPILPESYWISPFSYTFELKRLLEDIAKNKQKNTLKILVDLELPLLSKKLFLKNMFSFFKNKKLIKKFFKNADELNIGILTAEYPASSKFIQKGFRLLGVSYPIEKYPHKKIVMFYSSMIKNKLARSSMKKFIIKKSKEYGQNFQVGLGTIAIGILGNEPILSPENLDKDLEFLKKNKIKTATIFRLGGLNKKYLEKIKRYVR